MIWFLIYCRSQCSMYATSYFPFKHSGLIMLLYLHNNLLEVFPSWIFICLMLIYFQKLLDHIGAIVFRYRNIKDNKIRLPNLSNHISINPGKKVIINIHLQSMFDICGLRLYIWSLLAFIHRLNLLPKYFTNN